MGIKFKYLSIRFGDGKRIMTKEGAMRWNSSNEKMYILKARKGCLPVWDEVDPFDDLEERKIKK